MFQIFRPKIVNINGKTVEIKQVFPYEVQNKFISIGYRIRFSAISPESSVHQLML